MPESKKEHKKLTLCYGDTVLCQYSIVVKDHKGQVVEDANGVDDALVKLGVKLRHPGERGKLMRRPVVESAPSGSVSVSTK